MKIDIVQLIDWSNATVVSGRSTPTIFWGEKLKAKFTTKFGHSYQDPSTQSLTPNIQPLLLVLLFYFYNVLTINVPHLSNWIQTYLFINES